MADPLTTLLSATQSAFFSATLRDVAGVSPNRMMLINPRKFFEPTDEFDFSKVLGEVLLAKAQDLLSNLVTAHVPGANFVIAAMESYIPTVIKESDGRFYSFYINPQNMKVTHQKISQEVLTGGGWDFDVFGDQLSLYTFDGTTGNLQSGIFFGLNFFNISLSRTFMKFVALEQFYLYNNNDPLLLVLDQTAYIGKMVSLDWSWSADDIYQIKYNFAWKINPKYTFDILSGAGVSELFGSGELATLFKPSLQENIFRIQDKSINVYEDSMSLFEE